MRLIESKILNDLYHKSSEMFKELDDLVLGSCKDKLISKLLHSDENDVDNIPYYVINNDFNSTEIKNKTLIIFGEHPRELITTELGFYLINVLCKTPKSKFDEETINFFLNHFEFYIVPIVNIPGRVGVEEGNYCKRTNENQVDLNRNWNVSWVEENGEGLSSGKRPFSEWQTRALKKLMEDVQPQIFITTHSGNLGLYTPLAYSSNSTDGDSSDILSVEQTLVLNNMKWILNIPNQKYCKCKYGSLDKNLYNATGTCLDYAFLKQNILYSFAFEIFYGETSNEFWLENVKKENILPFHLKSFFEDYKMNEGYKDLKNFKHSFLKKPYDIIENSNPSSSCFLQREAKYQKDEKNKCLERFNPLKKIEFENTLLIWTNIYLETLALLLLN